jgi:membrane-bound metal-dependent hydrolase YbcI (DUF457 family)
MFITAHLVAGLLIGELTGYYIPALIGSLFLDLDHLIAFAQQGAILNLRKFWRYSTAVIELDGERTVLHSFTAWLFLSIIVVLFSPSIGIAFSLGYFFHLMLDMLDGEDFYGLWPLKINFHGPIRYLSGVELVITFAMLVAWLML